MSKKIEVKECDGSSLVKDNVDMGAGPINVEMVSRAVGGI